MEGERGEGSKGMWRNILGISCKVKDGVMQSERERERERERDPMLGCTVTRSEVCVRGVVKKTERKLVSKGVYTGTI